MAGRRTSSPQFVSPPLNFGGGVVGEGDRPVSNLESAPPVARGRPEAVLSVSPHEDAVSSPTTPITVAFRSSSVDFNLEVDGRDVTSDCLVRETMSLPRSRVEVAYRPGAPLSAGEHTVVARSPGIEYSWTFTVT